MDTTWELVGLEIHDLDREVCFLATPNGGRFYFAALHAEFRAWAARCDGTRTRAELLAGMAPKYAEVVDVLVRYGCLRPPEPGRDVRRTARIAATTVLTICPPALHPALSDALAAAGYAAVEPAPEDLTGVDVRDTVLVAAFWHPAYLELDAIDEQCARLGLRWLPLRRELGRLFLGPAITPGATADFADVVSRRLSATPDRRVVDALMAAPAVDGPELCGGTARWVAAQLGAHLERWIADGTEVAEIELDPVSLTTVSRTVLPVPSRPRPVVRGDRPGVLVDDQVGVVTGVRELEPLPGMPARLRTCAVDLADMRRVADWSNDRQAFGTSWSGFDLARGIAVGEAVERYCGSWLPHYRLRHGSYNQLRRSGVPALDPRRLHLYSARQYESAGFPFVPLTVDAECAWVEGRSVTTGVPAWVPAFLVSHSEHDPVAYSAPLVAGAAAGMTEEHAVTSGLEEVIERDATMVWWANAARLPRLPLTAGLHALIADSLDAYEVTLIHLDNEFGVPVVAAAVRDRVTGWLTVGFAARADAVAAAEKAMAEGFTLHHTCHFLDREHEVAGHDLKSHRADRRYLDSYRADFADVRDLLCQQQIHLDARAGERVAPQLRDLPTRSWDGLPALGERRLKAYLDRVESRGFEVITVDMTTCDVEAAGFTATHTLVPGLVSNFPAGLPFWGNGRISRAGVALGWRSAPLAEEELNVFPLPHA